MTYETFSELMAIAARETGLLSGGHHRNKNIKEILANADENTITFACLELADKVHLSLAVLYHLVPLTDRPPIPDYYAGCIPVILECWKYWALERKYVFSKYSPTEYWVEDKFGHRGDWH